MIPLCTVGLVLLAVMLYAAGVFHGMADTMGRRWWLTRGMMAGARLAIIAAVVVAAWAVVTR